MSTRHYDRKIKVIRKCDICGIESNPGGMGNHQRASGHTGYTQRIIDLEKNGNKESPTFLEKLEKIPIDRQLLGYFLVIALRFVYFLLLIIILIRV